MYLQLAENSKKITIQDINKEIKKRGNIYLKPAPVSIKKSKPKTINLTPAVSKESTETPTTAAAIEPTFLDKYKLPIILAGAGLVIYMLINKKNK
jgi:hypothetical protein